MSYNIKISTHTPENELAMGDSKMWGNPDMPSSFEFPTFIDEEGEENHYEFVCQINCCEIAQYDPDAILPHKGMLYFFARIDYYLGDFLDKPMPSGFWGKDGVKVYYYPKNDFENFEQIVLIDEDDKDVSFKEQKIEFSNSSSDSLGEGCAHKLLGKPSYIGDDIDLSEYALLFQLDSCEVEPGIELNFMDCGMLYFLIPISDLKRPSFKNVRGYLASS